MNEQKIKLEASHIQCDNPGCDYIDTSATIDNLKDYVNKSCPKCGSILLTQEDFIQASIFHIASNAINNISEEDMGLLGMSRTDNPTKLHIQFKDGMVMKEESPGNQYIEQTNKFKGEIEAISHDAYYKTTPSQIIIDLTETADEIVRDLDDPDFNKETIGAFCYNLEVLQEVINPLKANDCYYLGRLIEAFNEYKKYI